MQCKNALSLIIEHVDGRLSAFEQAQLKRHTADCGSCRGELRAHLSLANMIAELERPAPRHDFSDRVLEELRAEGRIVAPAQTLRRPALGGVTRARAGVGGWLAGRRWVMPTAAAVVFLVAASWLPTMIKPLGGLMGKTAVLAADAYVEAEQQVPTVKTVDRVTRTLLASLRAVGTVLAAFVSLIETVAGLFWLPAMAFMAILSLGFLWLFRSMHRMGASNATIPL